VVETMLEKTRLLRTGTVATNCVQTALFSVHGSKYTAFYNEKIVESRRRWKGKITTGNFFVKNYK
jgi:hypothetical protein